MSTVEQCDENRRGHTSFNDKNNNENKRLRIRSHVFGGRCRVRTCDPCRVKAVLYH